MEAIKYSRKKNKPKSINHLVIANHLDRLKGHIKCITTRDDGDQVGRGKEEKQIWSTAYSKGVVVFVQRKVGMRGPKEGL